jgi:hypothetical protein
MVAGTRPCGRPVVIGSTETRPRTDRLPVLGRAPDSVARAGMVAALIVSAAGSPGPRCIRVVPTVSPWSDRYDKEHTKRAEPVRQHLARP